MAQYDKETKFYWLQLKEDFFEDDAIQWLEEQEPNGRDYAYFYLKLCLKSLKSNGVLIRKVGDVLIPYNNKKLAELTKMDFDTVTVAMELLKKIGLIKVFENGELYLSQVENMIGATSKGAFKKQQQLARRKQGQIQQGGIGVENFPPKLKLKLDKELDIKLNNNICPSEMDIENEFEIIWRMYPKKQGKAPALKSYIKARKKGVKVEDIKIGLQKYIDYIQAKKIDTQYIKNGSTWFNQECWNDDYSIPTLTKSDEQLEILKGVYDGTIKIK